MSQPLNVIIVEKAGTLKSLAIKDFKLEELYKKCGFKKGEDFLKQTEWSAKFDNTKYYIEVYGKAEGRPGAENQYDFPPPIDNTLLFGSCAIIAYKKEDDKKVFMDLTLPIWNKAYEMLFGGFEDLDESEDADDDEDDELAKLPESKKTKQGYVKDGFVVDDNSSEEDNEDIAVEDVGSELSEEEYDYN